MPQTSRSAHKLQGVVLFQTAFSLKEMNFLPVDADALSIPRPARYCKSPAVGGFSARQCRGLETPVSDGCRDSGRVCTFESAEI